MNIKTISQGLVLADGNVEPINPTCSNQPYLLIFIVNQFLARFFKTCTESLSSRKTSTYISPIFNAILY